MKVRGALSDLLWRIMAPSLAEAWDAGYKARQRDINDGLWGSLTEPTPNPFLLEETTR